MVIAVKIVRGKSDDVTVRASNADPQYESGEFSFPASESGWESLVVDRNVKSWVNYIKVAARGALEVLARQGDRMLSDPPQTIELLVSGSLPASSGLSSSAAMTVSSVLAIAFAYHPEWIAERSAASGPTRTDLTIAAIESERLVGVNSGGMDQAASVFGAPSKLLHIHFVPSLRTEVVAVPVADPPLSFVIANSLVTADKHQTAKIHYNLRVVENRVGAALLAQSLGFGSTQEDGSLWSFQTVLNAYAEQQYGSKPLSPDQQRANIEKVLTLLDKGDLGADDGLAVEAVEDRLSVDDATFNEKYTGGYNVEYPGGKLRVLRRARHVLTEAARVFAFRNALEANEKYQASQNLPRALGNLMNASQDSLRDDFDCSCPEIEEMNKLARAAGAIGSRITGAGWGGSTVHLVAEEDERRLIDAMKKEYYDKKFPGLNQADFEAACFATKPGAGACIIIA